MNTVILSGRLATDIRVYYTKTGKNLIRFSLAVQKGFDRDAVNYFDIEIWNKLAEVCADCLLRGDRIHVKGFLDTSRYEDEQGHTQYRTKVVAREVEFLTPKRKDKSAEEMPEALSDELVSGVSLPVVDDDDIPL